MTTFGILVIIEIVGTILFVSDFSRFCRDLLPRCFITHSVSSCNEKWLFRLSLCIITQICMILWHIQISHHIVIPVHRFLPCFCQCRTCEFEHLIFPFCSHGTRFFDCRASVPRASLYINLMLSYWKCLHCTFRFIIENTTYYELCSVKHMNPFPGFV